MILRRIMMINTAVRAQHFTFPTRFSTIKLSDFSENAQRATWASAMIRQILFAQPTEAFDTLRRRMKILHLPSSVESWDPAIQQEMKRAFTDGIFIPSYALLNQNRLAQGQSQNVFVFSPNYTMTKYMFKHLFDNSNCHFISGEYGTSKTTSAILADHLSKPILKFKLQSVRNQHAQQELKTLKGFQLIHNTPKFLYWSLGMKTQELTQNRLMSIVKSQLSQLPAEELERISKITNISELQIELKQLFRAADGIFIKVVIDQINTAASIIRDWNKLIFLANKQLQQLKDGLKQIMMDHQNEVEGYDLKKRLQMRVKLIQTKEPLQNMIDKAQRNLEKVMNERKAEREIALKIALLIESYREFGHLVLFNSSVNMEDEILKYSIHKNYPLIGLQILGFHYRITREHIHYYQSLQRQKGRNDFYNYFWFEIQRRIKHEQPQHLLQKFEKKFYSIVQKLPVKHQSRPIFVYQFITQRIEEITKVILPFIENDSEIINQDEERYLRSLVQQFTTYCYEHSKQKILLFANNLQKRRIVTLIYEIAKTHQRFKQQEIVIDLQTFYSHFDILLSDLLLSNDHNKDFIPLEYNTLTRQFFFHWNVKEFMDIAKNIVDPSSLYRHLFDQYMKKYHDRYPPQRGYYFKYALIQLLQPGVRFVLKYPYLNINTNSTILFESQEFLIYSCSTFISLDAKPKNNSIQYNFGQIMQQAKENPSKTIIGLSRNQKVAYDFQSPTIDFILMKYHKDINALENSYFQVQTVDITISDKDPPKKEQSARAVLSELIKRTPGIKIVLKHTILCSTETYILSSQNAAKKKAKAKPEDPSTSKTEVPIRYCSYDRLEIIDCPNKYYYQYTKFEGFRKYLKYAKQEMTL